MSESVAIQDANSSALGAAAGAYTGSLVGALDGMDNDDPQDPAQPRHAGVVLAVAVATNEEESTAIDTMRAQSSCSTRLASCVTVTGSILIG